MIYNKRSSGLVPNGRVFWAGVTLGAGLGGFFDGIVLHQLLQWHHLVSNVYPPNSVNNLQTNTLWDGILHAGTWILTLVGVLVLLKAVRERGSSWSWQAVWGGLLAGFGLFNVIEGLVNHFLLQIHHVRPGPDMLFYDLGFLALGQRCWRWGGC